MKVKQQQDFSSTEDLVSKKLKMRIFNKHSTHFLRSVFSLFLLMCLPFVFSVLPLEFCHAVGTPTFWDSRVYPLGLVDEGSANAGQKNSEAEFAFLPTSEWTTLSANLQTGNFMVLAPLVTIQGVPNSLSVFLTYNHLNAGIDIGVGKGWMTNLHACVSEDAQTHALTYVTGTGAKIVFLFGGPMMPYINPLGFVGKAIKNLDGTFTITPLGEGSFTFDSTGKLTTLSNQCDDGVQTVSYTSGRPTAITDSLSDRAITLTWNESGKLTAITDNMSHSWALGYSQSGDDLVSLTQPVTTSPPDCEFSYDANHKMETHTDFLGSVYEIDYIESGDHAGKLYSVTDPNDHVTSLAYAVNVDGYAKQTILTDAEDRDTAYYFGSSSGQLERIQQGSGETFLQATFSYNALGLVSAVTDSYSKSSSYTYDSVGHLLAYAAPAPAENEDPYTLTMTYYPSNSVEGVLVTKSETVSSQTNAETVYEYEDEDAPCKPSSIINPLNQETTIDYNSTGLVASVTQPIPDSQTKTTSFSYNQTTFDLTKITDAEGNDTVMTYNNNGLVSNRTVYNGTQLGGVIASNIDFTYSTLLLLTGTEDDVTDLTTFASFNANGAQLAKTTELGCESSQSYSTVTDTSVNRWKYVTRSALDGSYRPTPITVSPGWGGGEIRLPVTFPIFTPDPCSATDSQSHTTTFTYDDTGLITQATDYLDNDTDYTYDTFGRPYTVTRSDGNTVTYSYNRNSWVTSVVNESTGTTGFTYDFAGRATEVADPVKGTIEYEYNTRGDLLSETFGLETNSFAYDLLGRKTNAYYEYGSSETWTYTPDGYLASHNGIAYEYNKIGAVTEADLGADGTMTYAYTGTLSEVLKLPSSVAGTDDLGDYSFTYNTKHWLSGLSDTSKTNQSYSYAYSSSKELNELDYPNTLELHQTWTSKMLGLLTVTDASQQTTYLSSDATYNANEQMSDYDFSVNAGQNTFSEAYDLTYDTKGRLSTMETDSSSRTLTYGYDAYNGQLTSLAFSDLGTYAIDYLGNGNIDTITYPNSQGMELYTYDGGKGRLSEITYPNNDTLEFQWNAKDQVTRLDYYDFSADSTTSYVLAYNDLGRLASSTHLVDSITQSVWTYAWGLHGLEIATKTMNGQTALTQDFTTDPNGTILSMTFSTPGEGYDGELYFHYDHFGNTTLLTDEEGDPVASFEYDLHSGKVINEWNPSGLEVMNLTQGQKGALLVELHETLFYVFTKYNNNRMITSYGDIKLASGSTTPSLTDEQVENNCRYECSNERCEGLFQAQDSSKFKCNDYNADAYNCKFIACCLGLYINSIHDSPPDNNGNVEIDDYSGNPPSRMSYLLRDNRKSTMMNWWMNNQEDCNDLGVYLSSYTKIRGNPKGDPNLGSV